METSHNFERICRTCMLQSASLLSLFDDNSQCTESTQMLTSFTTVKANPMDGLPQRICISCVAEINQVISFKLKCERSDQTLKSLLKAVQPKTDLEIEFVGKSTVKNVHNSEQPETAYYLDAIDENSSASIISHETMGIIEELDDEAAAAETDLKLEIVTESNDKYGDEEMLDENQTFFIDGKAFEIHVQKDDDLNSVGEDVTVPSSSLDVETSVTIKRVKYKCKTCSKEFKTKQFLRNHEHANKCSLRSFQCYVCKLVLSSMSNLARHLTTHSNASFTCAVCDKQFRRADQLNRHLRNHSSIFKHWCSYCSKGFNMLSTLNDHVRSHSGEKPFACGICDKRFTQKTNLGQHLKRHANIRKFSCDVCGIAFVTKGELDSHYRAHTGQQSFVCDTCGNSCTTSSGLVKHMRIHTGERPYGCEFCPMKFRVLATLRNHQRKHTGEKPYECEICQRRFAQRSDCVKHQRSHTDERYHCPICRQEFVTESAANAHLKRAHNINHDAIFHLDQFKDVQSDI